MAHQLSATVIATENLSDNVKQVTIRFASDFRFSPGQYVLIRFGGIATRAYCIASAPERPGAVQLCIRPGLGKGSQFLDSLKIGDQLLVEGPAGEFVIPRNNSPIVFVAGDTGIAPVRSIVLHLMALGTDRRVTVLYEPREGEVLYARDFEPISRSGKIRYERGKIEDLLSSAKAELNDATVMICGYDEHVERATKAIESFDVTPAGVVTETFGRSP